MERKEMLHSLVEKEVSLMREILANLYLQESSKKNGIPLTSLIETHESLERALEMLKDQRASFPLLQEESCELKLLFEQIDALQDKIELQRHLVAIQIPLPYAKKTPVGGKPTIVI